MKAVQRFSLLKTPMPAARNFWSRWKRERRLQNSLLSLAVPFYIMTAVISMLVLISSSLALFKLAPMVTVEPFLIIRQDESQEIVREEPITSDMSSKDKLMETFIRQYVISRNTIINDPMEMRSRWNRGGMVNFLSSPEVFDAFNRSTQANWEIYSNRRWSARWKSFPSASRAAKRVRFGKWILKHMTCMTNKAKIRRRKSRPCGFAIGPLPLPLISSKSGSLWAAVCSIRWVLP